jgi:hypothetical protein
MWIRVGFLLSSLSILVGAGLMWIGSAHADPTPDGQSGQHESTSTVSIPTQPLPAIEPGKSDLNLCTNPNAVFPCIIPMDLINHNLQINPIFRPPIIFAVPVVPKIKGQPQIELNNQKGLAG